MKKIVFILMTVIILLNCTACNKTNEEPSDIEPQISQMKSICDLAVMECYYHNVAKYFEEDAVKGLFGIGNKDKHFWIEYSGVVKLGIDVSFVSIEIEDTQISITLPEAKVLNTKIDSASLNDKSFIVDKKSADIEAADEVRAFDEAQSKLEETASNDKILLANAQQRAQELLENYITNIGNAVGKQYSIKWIYVDAEGRPLGSIVDQTVTSTENEESST